MDGIKMKINREDLRSALVDATMGCGVQHDGWPCNTCFHSLELNITPGRLHELWEAVLSFRGDYNDVIDEYNLPIGNELETRLNELLSLLTDV